MPLASDLREPLEAQWEFQVVDMDRRLVAFKDLSHGTITSWSWDFDDGTTSAEQHPIHQYQETGGYTVVLTIQGPEGTAHRIKVRQVVVR